MSLNQKIPFWQLLAGLIGLRIILGAVNGADIVLKFFTTILVMWALLVFAVYFFKAINYICQKIETLGKKPDNK